MSCVFKGPEEDKSERQDIDIRDCYKGFPILYAQGRLLSEKEIALATTQLADLATGKATLQPKIIMYFTKQGQTICEAYATHGVLVRNIAVPSYFRDSKKKEKRSERLSDVEVRKVSRNTKDKQGNPNRSAIWIAAGAHCELYCGQGYLSFINSKQLKAIGLENLKSGHGKKTEFKAGDPLSEEEALQQLTALKKCEQMGGLGRKGRGHHEIIADFSRYDGVVWTPDPTHHHKLLYHFYYPPHPWVSLLQALCLQNSYKMKQNIKLPLFRYSFHGYLQEEKDFSDKEILDIWRTVVSDYLKSELGRGELTAVLKTVEEIKVACVYGNSTRVCYPPNSGPGPADFNYPPLLQKSIEQIIESEKQALYAQELKKCKQQLLCPRLNAREVFFLLNDSQNSHSSTTLSQLEGKFYFTNNSLYPYKKIFKLAETSLPIFRFIIQNIRTIDGRIDGEILNGFISSMHEYGFPPLNESQEKIIADHRKNVLSTSVTTPEIPIEFIKKFYSELQTQNANNMHVIFLTYKKGLHDFTELKLNNPCFQCYLQDRIDQYESLASLQKDGKLNWKLVSKESENFFANFQDIENILMAAKQPVEETPPSSNSQSLFLQKKTDDSLRTLVAEQKKLPTKTSYCILL